MKSPFLKFALLFSILSTLSFAQTEVKMNKSLKEYVSTITTEFGQILDERKKTLIDLGNFIIEDKQKSNKVLLTFICTSNSRRSHLSQVWMQTATIYYGIDSVFTFSGGTEATEVNKRAIEALKRAGFTVSRAGTDYNSPYSLTPGSGSGNWMLYSKKYSNVQNPKSDFIAVMVCSEADKSCPVVPGAEGRIGLPYEDPKYYDNTPSEQQKYDETCRLIARELFFVADYVKSKLILMQESAKQ